MSDATPSDALVAAFRRLPAQMQKAARYLLDNPGDAALLSMREQARRAGVRPATMTRLAQAIGYNGFDDLRAVYAAALRGGTGGGGFAGRAGAQLDTQARRGDSGLADDMLSGLVAQIEALRHPETLERVVAMADRLTSARRVMCLGLRSSHPVAWHLHYALSLLGERSVLLDGVGGTGLDPLHRAGADDLLLVVGIQPYTRHVVDAAAAAHARGIPVAALTDSEVSPLATHAELTLTAPTQSPSFLHTMTPTFALGEVLAALVAGQDATGTIGALSDLDAQLTELNTHLNPKAQA